MIHTLAAYQAAGNRAARAAVAADLVAYQKERAWLSQALALEAPYDRYEAQAAFNRGVRLYNPINDPHGVRKESP